MSNGKSANALVLDSSGGLTHCTRVGYDKSSYDEFMAGFEPLVAPDVAEAAAFMLSQKERVSIKALDVIPTAQRSLQVFDREWNSRSSDRKESTM